MDAADISAVLMGAAAVIGATAKLVKELRRSEPPRTPRRSRQGRRGEIGGLRTIDGLTALEQPANVMATFKRQSDIPDWAHWLAVL
jgi:hypothetical protein